MSVSSRASRYTEVTMGFEICEAMVGVDSLLLVLVSILFPIVLLEHLLVDSIVGGVVRIERYYWCCMVPIYAVVESLTLIC